MIDINQIRQGNYIKYSMHDYWAKFIQGCHVQVDLDIYLDIDKHPDCFEPIELTPDWLKKLGFGVDAYADDDSALVTLAGVFALHVFNEKTHLLSISHAPKARKLKYVHEVQNYIQSLTGEELTIKTN